MSAAFGPRKTKKQTIEKIINKINEGWGSMFASQNPRKGLYDAIEAIDSGKHKPSTLYLSQKDLEDGAYEMFLLRCSTVTRDHDSEEFLERCVKSPFIIKRMLKDSTTKNFVFRNMLTQNIALLLLLLKIPTVQEHYIDIFLQYLTAYDTKTLDNDNKASLTAFLQTDVFSKIVTGEKLQHLEHLFDTAIANNDTAMIERLCDIPAFQEKTIDNISDKIIDRIIAEQNPQQIINYFTMPGMKNVPIEKIFIYLIEQQKTQKALFLLNIPEIQQKMDSSSDILRCAIACDNVDIVMRLSQEPSVVNNKDFKSLMRDFISSKIDQQRFDIMEQLLATQKETLPITRKIFTAMLKKIILSNDPRDHDLFLYFTRKRIHRSFYL